MNDIKFINLCKEAFSKMNVKINDLSDNNFICEDIGLYIRNKKNEWISWCFN